MLATDIIRTMIDYNYTAHRRLWESIMTLTEEQFTADIPYSHGSIHHLMIHLASVDAAWLLGLKEEPNARAFAYDPAAYPTRESTRALQEASANDVMTYVATLDDAALAVQPQGLPIPVWQVLLHLVNHGTDHRAQVLRGLHDLGAPTFGQDLLYYFMGRLTTA